MADEWDDLGKVFRPQDEPPPSSSLVEAFKDYDDRPGDAIVLRGYLGRSEFFKRTRDYLERARRIVAEEERSAITKSQVPDRVDPAAEAINGAFQALEEIKKKAGTGAPSLPQQVDEAVQLLERIKKAAYGPASPIDQIDEAVNALKDIKKASSGVTDRSTKKQIDDAVTTLGLIKGAAGGMTSEIDQLDHLLNTLEGVRLLAAPHVALRLYLTPSLDRYVDFHRSSLLAYRREPRPERRDTFTVWLRVFETGSQMPIPYRVVQETVIGPSFATYLGGELIDDYLEQPGSSSAWGDQAVFGGKPWSGTKCAVFGGKPWSGTKCAE
jgi:hypothetical protein